jgi:transglutaminase-like putative cysteine protease/tetratricopeptide (TPR) repeat protein
VSSVVRKFLRLPPALVLAVLISSSIAAPGHAGGGNAAQVADTKASAPVQTIASEPMQTWVRERVIPQATKARLDRAQNGTIDLLADVQYRTRADGHDSWFRLSTKVTNRSGLETAGQLSIVYDPAFESVGLNFIHLIRDGKIIDLTDRVHFRVVEHEDELDDGIVGGTLKAITNLPDVRVGDVIDYATTVHTRSTLWPGHAFYHLSQRYSDPLAMRAIRFVWPAGMSPRVKTINSDVAFATRVIADGMDWEWTTEDPPAMQVEDNVPYTAFQWGRIDISTMKDWAELARWAADLYRGDESLPGDFSARLDAIAKTFPAPGDRLTEATRYVQDNIRYVGEELGEGSYVPRRPGTVLAQGYGDCKDKSLLLAVALRRLGIDAVPALVSTRAGERLPDRLPSPLEFDHVIVRAVIDGKVVWIDPTGNQQGGRGAAIVPADFGYALPVRAGQAELEHMEGYGDHAGRVTVLERFTVDETADTPLILHVETRHTGARADNSRASTAASSTAKIADSNLAFYRRSFPGLIASKPLELGDDRDANVTTMIEDYSMSRDAFAKANIVAKLITRAYLLQDVLPDRQANPRVQPLSLNDELVNEQTIELHIKDRTLSQLDNVDMKAGSVAFSRQTTKLPDGLRMIYRLETGPQDFVPAKDAESIYVLSDRIKHATEIEYYLDKSPHAAPVPKGIDPATWESIKPDMVKIGGLMQKSDQASRLEALSLLSGLSDKVAHPSPAAGLIDGMKGSILSDLQRPQAAWAALQSSAAQYQGNPDILRLWVGYELDYGTGESVAAAMRRVAQFQPGVIAAIDTRWMRIAMQKARQLAPDKRGPAREDICIALAGAGWQQQPRTDAGDDILGCAIAAHSLRGELSEARAGLAKNPPTAMLAALAIDRRHQALWPEIDQFANEGFRKSLESGADRTAAAAKGAPKDYAVVENQMQALRALGRFGDAVQAGAVLARDKTQIEVTGHDAFWMVNEYASNLRALGRIDEAVAALDSVLALGINNYPDLVSLAINRAEMVVAAGHYQSGLDSLSDLEAHHLDQLSVYGKMWIWANEDCALRALGRSDDAKVPEAKLAAKPDDNWSAAAAAAACRDDTKAIADMLVTRLRDSDARPTALGLFITFGAREAQTPLETTMRHAMANARAMPEVQAEFRKYGRAIRYAGTTEGWSEF